MEKSINYRLKVEEQNFIKFHSSKSKQFEFFKNLRETKKLGTVRDKLTSQNMSSANKRNKYKMP